MIDLSRQVGGVDGATLINDMNIYSYAAAGQQDWRSGATEGDLVTLCNKEYAAHTDLPQADLPQPAPPAFARDPYGTVALICEAYRTIGRALYNAGPNLTQKSAIKAFEALPYTDSIVAKGSPAPRAAQIINHPPTKVEYTQVLVKPEYPCAHPSLPTDPANNRICLIPQPGYEKGGKAVEGPFFVARELAALAAEEHRAGKVVARRELARGTVEADPSLLDEDDAVGDRGGDIQ